MTKQEAYRDAALHLREGWKGLAGLMYEDGSEDEVAAAVWGVSTHIARDLWGRVMERLPTETEMDGIRTAVHDHLILEEGA